MHNFLLQIIEEKRKDLVQKSQFLNFPKDKMTIIAEIKLASPTIRYLGSKKDIIKRAVAYEKAGVDAISVITERRFFKGSPHFISLIKTKVSVPILQKDFVIDPFQIYEAKIIGANAILLIAKLVDKKTLINFVALSQKLGIEPVVEISDETDLKKAAATSTAIIAVNARNLETFIVNIDIACKLIKKIPDRFIKLGFSGIKSSYEVKKYQRAGAKGILVGTSLMKTKNILNFIKEIKIK